MSTHTQILYHIVFATKDRNESLPETIQPKLHAYIRGVLNESKCTAYQVGGMTDHVHILCSVHPSQCLADLVKTVKIATGNWLRTDNRSPIFDQWQEGYGAFTVSYERKEQVVSYIANQAEHHAKFDYIMELKNLLDRAGIEYDPKWLP